MVFGKSSPSRAAPVQQQPPPPQQQQQSTSVADLLANTDATLCGNVVELIKDRLAFAAVADGRAPNTSALSFFTFPEAHYESFYHDFGPLNLSVLFRFCLKMHLKLSQSKRRPIVVLCGDEQQQRVNSAYLVGAYCIIYQNMTAEKCWSLLRGAQPPKFIAFRDAAMGPSTYDLTLLDTLRGVQRAVEFGWLNFDTFDCDEYEYYERVENGDFNWLLPGKFLAFCGPHNEAKTVNGYPFHPPETYFSYFRAHRVSTIVRLNKKMYDARKFTAAGFDHIDLFFVDGSTPSDEIVQLFLDACDTAPGALAVHCKAGLGRTGTLIACWMMKEYGVTAAECMAWLRICRPGSVIGPQQQFLLEKQEWCWAMGGKSRLARPASNTRALSPSNSNAKARRSGALGKLVYKVDDIRLNGVQQQHNGNDGQQRPSSLAVRRKDENTNEIGTHQGDRLLALKAARQHQSQSASGSSSEDDDEAVPVGIAGGMSRALFTSPTTPVKAVRSGSAAGSAAVDGASRSLRFTTHHPQQQQGTTAGSSSSSGCSSAESVTSGGSTSAAGNAVTSPKAAKVARVTSCGLSPKSLSSRRKSNSQLNKNGNTNDAPAAEVPNSRSLSNGQSSADQLSKNSGRNTSPSSPSSYPNDSHPRYRTTAL